MTRSSVAVRIVFSDMDGTFLTTDKRVTSENLRALDLLAEKGVTFVPCTGRPFTGIPQEVLDHSASRWAVPANGASVIDLATGETVHRSLMGPERVLALYEAFGSRNILFDVFADGVAWSERARYDRIGTFGIEPFFAASLRSMRTPIDDDIPALLRRCEHVERVSVYWKDERDRDDIVAWLDRDPSLSWVSSIPTNIEISDASTSKGSGLTWLCDHLGIPTSEAVAFGDSLNDASMLVAAGDGVAMANSTPDALAVADHVAGDNDHSGVCRYLEGLLG